jgi:hypothetical protein
LAARAVKAVSRAQRGRSKAKRLDGANGKLTIVSVGLQPETTRAW